MPEIAEVARIVHYLRKSLVGKTIKTVTAQDDGNVFGKVGTSGPEFQKALTGKKVVGAGQQGKYFWLIMESPLHPVFHFGMTGWLYIRGEPSIDYRPKGPKGETHQHDMLLGSLLIPQSPLEEGEWPPRFWKFHLETAGEPKVEVAFTDARRFGRIRLLDCAGKDIRNTTPLKENGPDPVIDKDVLTEEWLAKKMLSKHVPVKALLLDQANISGIGNWVGDEILYHAKLHPEQYSDTFSHAQLKQLHKSIQHVCQTAVDVLADSSKFPDEWLFNHRWGKGKKDAPTTLPNGAKITFLTVGGRTSCVVPSVQKKTGAVAGDVKSNGAEKEEAVEEDSRKGSKQTKRKAAPEKVAVEISKPLNGKGQKKPDAISSAEVKEEDMDGAKPTAKKRKADATSTEVLTKSAQKESINTEATAAGRRRSGRVSNKTG